MSSEEIYCISNLKSFESCKHDLSAACVADRISLSLRKFAL